MPHAFSRSSHWPAAAFGLGCRSPLRFRRAPSGRRHLSKGGKYAGFCRIPEWRCAGVFQFMNRQIHRPHVHPWLDLMDVIAPPEQPRAGALTVILIQMHRRQRTFWEWERSDWLEILCPSTNNFKVHPNLDDLSVELLNSEKSITTCRTLGLASLLSRRRWQVWATFLDGLSASWRNGNGWNVASAKNGVAPEWVIWVDRWNATTTMQQHSRLRYYVVLLKAGRWLTSKHPVCANPRNCTREIAAEWVATVCRIADRRMDTTDGRRRQTCRPPVICKG